MGRLAAGLGFEAALALANRVRDGYTVQRVERDLARLADRRPAGPSTVR